MRTSPADTSLPDAKLHKTRLRIRRELLPGTQPQGAQTEHPLWLELHLELSEENYAWFEGSINPWRQVDRPGVEWDTEILEQALKVAELPLPRAGLGAPLESRVVALAPHLYSLGVNRVRQELGLDGSEERIDLFPLVGFAPAEASGELAFHTLRTNVVVVDGAIVTVRLPDLLCPPSGEPQAMSSSSPLDIPPRFLPSWDATAAEVAEEVARHQAATTRALADRVRKELRSVLDQADDRPADESLPADARLQREREILDQLGRLTRIAEMADRQLARLLRRMGTYGDDGANREAADIRRRYGYALDEIRALGREIASARDRYRARADAERQAERERFQFVAALVGSAILVPTLVAGVFGANVWVPGERHPAGFGALIALIIAFAAMGPLVIDRASRRQWRPRRALRPLLAWIAVAALVSALALLLIDAAQH